MRLKASHRRQLIAWIADGKQSDEINALAAAIDDPFNVSRQQVDYYRKISRVDYEALKRAGKYDALTEGLALRSERVDRLQKLAALMEADIFGGLLWTDEVKGVGTGAVAEIVDYEVFNRAEVEEYRGVLDDIAREMGERKQEVNQHQEGELKVVVEYVHNSDTAA